MKAEIRTVVVGVATVETEDPVLRPAAELASALGATLHVVHAYASADPQLSAYSHPGRFRAEEHDLVSRMQLHVERLPEPRRVRCRAVADDPASALERVASDLEADLVIVGTTRRGPLARTVLGTTCGQVLRRVHAPVLLLRSRPAMPSRVLLATDLSEASGEPHDRGVRLARALAGGFTPEFRSLHVVRDGPLPATRLAQMPPEAAHARLRRFLEEREEHPEGLETAVRGGDAAAAIVAEAAAWGADPVVVGTHARKGVARLLLGSVAEATVVEAPCNVLVIPPVAAERPWEAEVRVELTPFGV